MLDFVEGGKPENPEKNPWSKNSTHMFKTREQEKTLGATTRYNNKLNSHVENQRTRRKTLGARTGTNNKLNAHTAPSLEPRPHWWEAPSSLLSLLP